MGEGGRCTALPDESSQLLAETPRRAEPRYIAFGATRRITNWRCDARNPPG